MTDEAQAASRKNGNSPRRWPWLASPLILAAFWGMVGTISEPIWGRTADIYVSAGVGAATVGGLLAWLAYRDAARSSLLGAGILGAVMGTVSVGLFIAGAIVADAVLRRWLGMLPEGDSGDSSDPLPLRWVWVTLFLAGYIVVFGGPGGAALGALGWAAGRLRMRGHTR